ncbi:hypothetical protein KAN5_23570 [Pseudoalteromonas sp. KAN5]|nr:hypothetical protein KAN5_23570 [Pseudoalteromonas sp. KAN5]
MLGLVDTKKEISLMNYQIGPWQFIKNRCVVVAGNIERELDPLLVKLLMHFISKPQQIIARQELVEQVWQQSFVDDNAINRAISELRKQLSHPIEKAPLLKTHYRKGYSLTVVATPLAVNEPQHQPNAMTSIDHVREVSLNATNVSDIKSDSEIAHVVLAESSTSSQVIATSYTKSKQFYVVAGVLLLVLITVIVSWLVMNNTKQHPPEQGEIIKTTATIIPSTWNVGAEAVPVLSFDKQYLAYSNTDLTTQQPHAFVKRIADQREIELHYQDFNVSILSWQLKQHSVLLQATKLSEQQCLMVLVDISDFLNPTAGRVIRECDLRYTGYAQLDESGTFLYFSEFKDKQGGAGLLRYNTHTKKETTLVPSSDILYGVLMPRISSSGKYIGYIQSLQGQPFSFFTYNLQTTEIKRFFQGQSKGISFAFDWLPNEDRVFVSEYDRLTTINVVDGSHTVREISPYLSAYYIAAQSANSFYFSPAQTQQLSIFKVTDLFSLQMQGHYLYQSEGNNYNALPLLSGQQASTLFISSRSGNGQIWLEQGDQQVQISNFTAQHGTPDFGFVRMASNGKFLLLKINEQLNFFDIEAKKLHSIAELKGLKVASYAWSDNNEQIWLIEQQDKRYQLWQFNLLTRELAKRNDIAPYALLNDNQGRSYAVTNDELIRLADDTRWQLPDAARSTSFHAINAEYLYISDGISRVARFNLTSHALEETHVDFKSFAFNVTDNNELLFNRRDVKDTQIKLVSW